ncbi:hypothetical protein [Chitinophaga rhizophila]|uniref:Uncharacterized protein n=1 Tax=Chitinophaga rhizophila TaxID=2866212 RepID=A0ABS7GFF9_9BACT|nr:hypothetical protein [Chitinophaga rhizophila]MBW8685243.1 hypothetical protein [Chitinophaga rhizophila]
MADINMQQSTQEYCRAAGDAVRQYSYISLYRDKQPRYILVPSIPSRKDDPLYQAPDTSPNTLSVQLLRKKAILWNEQNEYSLVK